MKTILVTGSNGLLGQKLSSLLIDEEQLRAVITSRSMNRLPFSAKLCFESMDISNKVEVDYILDKHQPEVIINTAAITSVEECEDNKSEGWKINADALQYLSEASNRHNAKLIHLSTDFVFDGIAGPYHEVDVPSPVSFYGLSKLEGEKIVSQSAKKWAIIRTVLVYGFSPNLSRSNFVLWVKRSLEQNQSIKVVDDQFRTPTLAEDLAWACIEIAKTGFEGIYHVSGDEFVSVYEFAVKTANVFGLNSNLITPVRSIELNENGRRPARTGFILTKAVNDLKYSPKSLFEGLSFVKSQIEK